jgi:hypothetical protein
MSIDQESFNKRLYEIFKTRGYKPSPKDSKNERTNPETADVFEFQFIKDGENYGKAWATIDKTASLNIYYDDNQAGSPPGKTKGVEWDDSWTGLLKHLKQWALSKQLNFGLHDSDRLGDDMRQRDYYKMKEKMTEGYHAVNQKTSYSDTVPNVKVVIQHDRQIGEGEQRWRNVHKIFVENQGGERFAVPTKKPGLARVYGRHVAEGGTPYDDRGKHITSLVEEYTKMAGFVNATRRGEFNESVAQLIAEGINHHKALKESLQKMQSHRGYNHYFESWTPPLMEDDSDSSSIAEMFAQETIDPRIESVLPILNRLNSGIINEIEEVNELDQWARGITEITEAEGDKCEICNGRGKIDYHSEDGPSKCQKCNGKGVQAWKPEPVNWGKSKVKEDAGCGCGCGPKSKCTCGPDCKDCDCGKENLKEGAFKRLVNDALEMSEKEFAKKHPAHAKQYNDIIDAHADDDDKERMAELNESYLQKVIINEITDSEVAVNVQRWLERTSKDARGDQKAIELAVKTRVKLLRDEVGKEENATRRKALGKESKILTAFLRSNNSSGVDAKSAKDAAEKEAAELNKYDMRPDQLSTDSDKVTIGRALSGIIPTLFSEERTDEFMRSDFDDDKPSRPRKGRLVTKDGQEVRLPYETVDFRGDKIVITGYQAPHKYGSTGRIYTDDGGSYFPGVADLKIIDHDYSDPLEEAEKPTTNSNHSTERDKKTYDPAHGHTKPEGGNPQICPSCKGAGCTQCDDGQVITPKRKDKKVDEDKELKSINRLAFGNSEDDDLADEESGKNHDPKTGKRTKPHPFNPDDDSIDEHRGPRNPRFSDEELIDKTDFSAKGIDKEIKMAYGILNDPRYKGGNMAGAIKAIEGIMPGLSEHPGVKKAIYMTQNEPDNLEEAETKMLSGCTVYSDGSPLSFADWRSETESETGHAMERSAEEQKSNYESYLKRCRRLTLKEIECGGQTFAGKYPCGKDGQWRNTGPTKGRPAKVGDLVGAESADGDDYRHGDTVTIDGRWHQLSLDDGTLYATDEDGGEHEFVKGSEQDHGHGSDRKDHKPDNMSESALNDILRLSGFTEYSGETGRSPLNKYKG